MKRLFFALALACLTLAVNAQHETLFNNARVVGGFGAPIVEMGLGNEMTTAVGGGGAVVIDNFFIGGYGIGSVDFNALIKDEEIKQIDLGHGGFWLGYTLAPHKLFHLYSSARIGWGGVGIDVTSNSSFPRDVDNVFVFTPEIGLELNVARWFRVAGTIGYRYVDGVNEKLGYYKKDDFNGTLANLTFRFGWFGWQRG
ncbi:MAG: hypothetical protein KDD06_03030 [Phaeodactylibacter sp.]|nr:hypothetical protein [Phaeodactylibacter sp.]MCB9288849.1 hypothetical protein [Lewinellaceae bacterium]